MKIVTKKSEQKRIKEECWNLDYELIKWLNEHLKVYKEDSSKVVNMEYHKFKYKKEEYTQLQILDRLIEITDFLLNDDNYGGSFVDLMSKKEIRNIEAKKNEMYDLLKLVHWQLWW